MKKILMTLVVAAACSGPKAKPESPIVNEGSDSKGETCCCKSFPIGNEGGVPAYEVGNRMECSTKQGTCVDDIQCKKQPTP